MRANLSTHCVAISVLLLLLGNPAHVAAIDFAAAKSYPVGTSPRGVAVGDFNGDGKLDVAVANTGSGNVSILLGNGDGTFQPAVNFSTGNSPTTVAMGDFNGDGKLDLALFQPGMNGLAGNVSVLLGNGDGTFQTPKTLALDAGASVMGAADFNLDKHSDLAVLDNSHVDIYIGNGDGTFQPPKGTGVFGSGGGEGMVVADFNGDSKPDLALTFSFSIPPNFISGALIWLGNGDGTFSTGLTVMVPTVNPNVNANILSVVTADLNHDGKVDLLLLSSGPGFDCPHSLCTKTITEISAFLGNGDGSFQGQQIVASAIESTSFIGVSSGSKIDRPFVGDFNGDGRLDLAYELTPVSSSQSSSLEIQLGKGDGTFSSVLTSGLDKVNPFAGSIAVAQDLNADKLTDLIAVGAANDIDVLLNTSPASGADLDIRTSAASPESVGVGRNLTYTADVLNQGPQDATGVTFTDTLPNNVSFVSVSVSQGSCVHSNGIVSCTLGSLASSLDFAVNIVVTPTVAGTLTNSMNVTSNEADPVLANNTATQTATVVPVFQLAVTKTGNGSGTVTTADGGINCGTSCSATYLSGTVVNVGETPDPNSVFTGWSGACTGTGACAVTMNGDMTITANFVLGKKLSVALAGSGNGSVTSRDGGINCANAGGNCSSLYVPGASVSLTAAPAETTSVFGGWSGACTGTDQNVCSVTMNAAQAVTATFNPPPPDFTMAPASTIFTVQKGARVTDALMLAGQNGFSGPLTLTCAVTGPAPMATCNISPSSLTLGSNSVSSTLTITAPSTLAAAALPLNEGSPNTAYALVLPFPALLLCGIGLFSRDCMKRRHDLWSLAASVIVLFAILVGCGGSTRQVTPQNYTVTVTAKSGSLQHTTTVTLTVQ
jgi:uncharacterized repeat protein (TIGR01451 family)